jgi:nucleotide-binding universal stress UspA family protein
MKVVLSANGTGEGRRALQWCLDHLHSGDEVIAVLGIDPVGEFVLGIPPFDTLGSDRELAQDLGVEYGTPLTERGILARTRLVPHSQVRALTEVATQEHADLIVVGKNCHGVVGDAVRNEVAPHLVHRPPCAVVVVPTSSP